MAARRKSFAQQLCDGGADLIQLRAKKSTPDEIRRMAEAILPVTRRANVGLVINDHPDIARETGAEFCHLGQEDFFDAGYKNVSELKGRDGSPSRPLLGRWSFRRSPRRCDPTRSANRSFHPLAGGCQTGAGGRTGLHRHRTGICDGHQTDGETGDTGIRPLGGGQCKHSVVRHWRHQFGDAG